MRSSTRSGRASSEAWAGSSADGTEQAAAHQPTRRAERVAFVGTALASGHAQQAQHQVDGWSAARDVVLQVGVQPLVAQIHVWRQAHQQRFTLERIELEQVRQSAQPLRNGADFLVQEALGQLGGGRLGEQLVDVVVRDVQAAERVARTLGEVDAERFDGHPQPQIESKQRGVQVRRSRARFRRWHGCRRPRGCSATNGGGGAVDDAVMCGPCHSVTSQRG